MDDNIVGVLFTTAGVGVGVEEKAEENREET